MGFHKQIIDLQLEYCCKKSLELIGVKREVATMLQSVTIPTIFLSLFVSPSKGGALTTVFSIYSTDWEMLAKATMGITAIARREVKKIAQTEQLSHLNGIKLRNFWEGIDVSFS